MSDLAIPSDGGIQSFGPQGGRLATSLDLVSQSGKMEMIRCMADCDARLTEEVNQPIAVVDWLVHEVEIVNKQTGESVLCTRMVLIDSDKMTHECVSNTLLQSFKMMLYAFGPCPWEPARVLIVKSKRRGERNIYWLEPKP